MPAGRPRKSLELHVVETGGKPRKRAIDRAAIEPHSKPIGAAPRRLNADQQKVWRDLLRAVPRGLVQASDAVRFEELVVAVAMQRQALEVFNAAGAQLVVARGRRKAGIAASSRELAALSPRIRVLAAEFGMTPASRSHVPMPKATAKDDPLAAFLRPKGGNT
jgi:P27 family predicted phage terminase small subunit